MNTATKPNGAAAAALLAAAIGVFVIGLMTSLAGASPGWANLLNWFGRVGPLSGKTGVGVIIWFIAWGFLHSRYQDVEVDLGRTLRWTWSSSPRLARDLPSFLRPPGPLDPIEGPGPPAHLRRGCTGWSQR